MISKLVLLLFCGITIATGRFTQNGKPLPYEITVIPRAQSSGCPSGPELAPLICKFMQQNIDLYYKPKLISPSTYIPSLVVEKCETPQLQMDIELPAPVAEKEPLVIPQPPELPPIVIPKFPVPVIIEAPPASVGEARKSSDIPEIQVLNIPTAPQLPPLEMPAIPQIMEQPEHHVFEEAMPEINYNTIEDTLMTVPQPPVLPTFTMPIKVLEQEPPMISAPCLEEAPVPEAPIQAYNQPLAPIPAAPELPPAHLPELPVRVEIPYGPVLPPMDILSPTMIIEQPAEEPKVLVPEIDYNSVQQPMSVPQPPELPAIIMPKLPVRMFEQDAPMIAAPCLEEAPIPGALIPAYIQPLAPMPSAPELPPTRLPEFPVIVEIPSGPVLPPMDVSSPTMIIEQPVDDPCLTEALVPEIGYNLPKYSPVSMPQPPELPEFTMPKLPVRVIEQEPSMDTAPFLDDQPAPINQITQPLASLPAAPELLPARLPEFPIHMEIPSGPILPSRVIPSSLYFIEQPEEPCLTEELVAPQPKPMVIPQPPKLPELIMPELPVAVPIVTAFVGEPCESSRRPAETSNEKVKETHKIMIPSQPLGPDFFPIRCVYNLVMEHVIPNIASDRFRSMENIEVLPQSLVPCS